MAYADDMVLIAKEEDEMKGIIERLEEYLGRRTEGAGIKCKEDKDYEVQERRRKMEEKGMEMEGRKDGGNEGIHVSKLYVTEKWRTGRAGKGEDKKSSGSDGTGVGNKKKEIWKKLGEKALAI